MFERRHSPHEIAHLYRRMGFEVSYSYQRLALIASRSLGAVAMPAGMGKQVRHIVQQDDPITTLPIISYRRAHPEWIFLVGPPTGDKGRRTAPGKLQGTGVRLLESGQRLWLPMTDHPIGWYWVSPPVSARMLPSQTEVLAAAQRQLPVPRAESSMQS
ncbi:hypothetical protein [Nocardia sp. NPDC003963]